MSKRWARSLIVAAIALVLASSSAHGLGRPGPRPPQAFSGIVTHVADGDTLDVAVGRTTVTVRLDGIDAPERGQPFSAQATRFLRALAFSQRATVLVKDTDRYGRAVARVVVGGKDLSEQMVAAGFAWHYVQYSSDARLAALEKQAREKRIGLWADRSAVPPWVARRPAASRPPSGAKAKVAVPGPVVTGPFHGNVSSRVYHAPGCPDYNCPNCRQSFVSREQAEAAGYRPHAACVLGRE